MDDTHLDSDFPSDSEESLSDDDPQPLDSPLAPSMQETPPIQLENTRNLRERQSQFPRSVAARVRAVLIFMDSVGLNLPLFLDYLSWGDVECVKDPQIRYERTALMVSDELPIVLKRWLSPPRGQDTHDVRAMGGKKYLEQFVVDCMQDIGSRELATLRSTARHLKRDLSQAQLTKMSLDDVVKTYKCMNLGVGAPRLWTVLQHLACTTDQQSRNTYKSPTLVCSIFRSASTCKLNSTTGYYLYHVDVIVFTISPQQ